MRPSTTSRSALFSGATREALRSAGEFAVSDRGLTELGNLSTQVRLYADGAGRPTAPLPIEPVCPMPVDADRAAGVLSFQGQQYPFCSLTCAARFAPDPQHFVAPGAAG